MSALNLISSVTATVEPQGQTFNAAPAVNALNGKDGITLLDRYRDLNFRMNVFLQKSGFPILIEIQDIKLSSSLPVASVVSIYLFGYLLRGYECIVNGRMSQSERTAQVRRVVSGLSSALNHALQDVRELTDDLVLAPDALSTAADRFRHYARDVVDSTSLRVPGNNIWSSALRNLVRTWLAIKSGASESVSQYDREKMFSACQDAYLGDRKIKAPTVI